MKGLVYVLTDRLAWMCIRLSSWFENRAIVLSPNSEFWSEINTSRAIGAQARLWYLSGDEKVQRKMEARFEVIRVRAVKKKVERG